jgi:orotidine-5'-phosphate decarboxylase
VVAEIIVALDLDSAGAALRLVDRLAGLRWAKVGPVLFVRGGPQLIRELTARGIRVFLDLKWHDIPSVVEEAVAAAAELGVALVTAHALGGRSMLEAAVRRAGAVRVAAVSVLTSHAALDYFTAVGRDAGDLAAEAARLARAAVAAGVHAIVTSPREVAAVRSVVGSELWIVVPGIRPPGSVADEQERRGTPREAVAAGATHLVVGRPVTLATDPAAVYQDLCRAVG